jgi:hypothetical protein
MAKARPIRGLDPHALTGQNARIIARIRLEDMYSWDDAVDEPYRIHELHNLRIATKRLRYTFEVFAAVLPGECAEIVKELTKIQDELGALHDSDVLIALLRLCLGSEDSGMLYEQALVEAGEQDGKGKTLVPPELVADVVDPAVAPTPEERYGLEQLLSGLQQQREEQYTSFRQHWYQLQSRDFRGEILRLLTL